jgi:nucleoside-diphosphate-sugar epimerase
MKIYVTGTTGTIGNALRGSNFKALDFRNWNSMSRLLAQEDEPVSIIHLAAVVGADNVIRDELSHETNVANVHKFLVEATSLCDLRNFVFASTGHVYAASSLPLEEGSELGPTSLYAQQKLEAENLLLSSTFSHKVTFFH